MGFNPLKLLIEDEECFSCRLLRRQKRVDRDMLLQGSALPKQLYLAKESLPEVHTLPAAPAQHGHEAMVFEEPANQEGEALIHKRISNRCPLPTPPPGSYSAFPIYPPAPHFAYPPGLPVPQSRHVHKSLRSKSKSSLKSLFYLLATVLSASS